MDPNRDIDAANRSQAGRSRLRGGDEHVREAPGCSRHIVAEEDSLAEEDIHRNYSMNLSQPMYF